MNTIAGMFMSCMPEPVAFECLRKFVVEVLPLYFDRVNKGSILGRSLVMTTLKLVDHELYWRIKNLPSFNDALLNPRVLCLMSAYQPFSEALKMWDFFMAFGFGLVPIAVAATLISDRDYWLNPSTGTDFTYIRPIDADGTIKLTLAIATRLPPDLLRMILKHPREYVDFTGYFDAPPAPVKAPAQKPQAQGEPESFTPHTLRANFSFKELDEAFASLSLFHSPGLFWLFKLCVCVCVCVCEQNVTIATMLPRDAYWSATVLLLSKTAMKRIGFP